MGLGDSLKIISDPVRREILQLLKQEKRTAGVLAQELNISPAALSYHLKLLKQGDFVLEYREKNFIWYELNTSIFDEIILWAQELRGDKHEEQ